MDIMHSLLFPVWQHEEQRKQSSYHEKLNRITIRLFRRIVSPPTPLQKKIIRWCGGDVPLSPDPAGMQSYLNQQNPLQQAAMNTGMVNYQNGNVTMAHTNIIGSSQLTPRHIWYSSSNQMVSSGSVLFYIIVGIEERCRKADIHRYDEDAVYMMDHRMIEKEIPILWLTSFCLSNRQDPEMAIVVLESNGYVIIEDDPS